MFKGFDSYNTPSDEVLRRAKSAGFDCAIQYYGPAGSPKVTTAADMARIGAAGLHVFMVFERYQKRVLEGAGAGQLDAELALAQAHAAGQPDGTTIAFAVDDDVDPNNITTRNALLGYFGAVKNVVLAGNKRVAGYAGGSVLTLLVGTGLITVDWVAGAGGWAGTSAYVKEDKWMIRQHPEIAVGASDNILGIAYDTDDIRDLDQIGAWMPGGGVVTPVPPPVIGDDSIDLFDLQRRLEAGGFYHGSIDGKPGDQTADALWAYYEARRPA